MGKGDDNLKQIKEQVHKGYKEVVDLKQQRMSINQDIASIRAQLETIGIKKEAFDMAMKYLSWDEEQRQGFDLAYEIARDAMGQPFKAQGDLFIKDKDKAEADADAQADVEGGKIE